MFNASAMPRGDVANYHFWLYRVWQHLACDPDLWLADFPVSSLAASVSLPTSNVIVSSLCNAADAWHNDMGMVFRVLEVRLSSVSERISGAQAQVTCDPHWSERDGRVQQCLQVFNFQHVGGILPSSPRNSDHRRACCFVFHYCPESRQSTCYHCFFLSSGVCDASLGWRLQSMRQSDVLIVETIRSKDGSTFRKQQKNKHGRRNDT